MAQGDMQKADVLAAEIGSYAAKVRDINDKLQAKYNEEEKKAGRPTNDFGKSIKAEVASMQASLNDALAQNKMAPLPDMNSSLASVPSKDNNTDSDPVSSAPVVALPNTEPSLGLDSGTVEEVKEPVKEATLADSLEQFETNVEDINKAPEVSIFKQLSNRYIMNYTKIFDTKPRPEVQEEPKPVPAAP
jgi:hypothetical protein